MIEQNPNVSMSDSFGGLSLKKVTERERLRLRALIGGVPVKLLADLTEEELVSVLKDAHSNPGTYPSDSTVQRALTEPLASFRIPEIVRHYLGHLHSEPTPEMGAAPQYSAYVRPRDQVRAGYSPEVSVSPGPQPRQKSKRKSKSKPKPRPRQMRRDQDTE